MPVNDSRASLQYVRISNLVSRGKLRRTEQKEISISFLGLVATPHKVAKVMGALSPE